MDQTGYMLGISFISVADLLVQALWDGKTENEKHRTISIYASECLMKHATLQNGSAKKKFFQS